MEINSKIYDKIKSNNNIITTYDVVSLGFSKTVLPMYVKEGLVERIRHGTYMLIDDIHDDMYTLMLRSDKIIFSHETAAFLNGLSDRTPFTHSVTLPTKSSLPNSVRGECKCYYVKSDLHKIGLISRTTTFGNVVRVYDSERTICDALRSRNRLDEEMFISIIKKYASYEEKNLNVLFAYASIFKVEQELKKYMEVLL